ncbi:MAG: hypothetical protein ACE144_05145 [Thermodesulfobacteriota bacterium]
MAKLNRGQKDKIEKAAQAVAKKTAKAMIEGFKEVGAPTTEASRDCVTGCGAGCAAGCGVGCGLTSPTGPVGTGLATGTGLTSGGAAGYLYHE